MASPRRSSTGSRNRTTSASASRWPPLHAAWSRVLPSPEGVRRQQAPVDQFRYWSRVSTRCQSFSFSEVNLVAQRFATGRCRCAWFRQARLVFQAPCFIMGKDPWPLAGGVEPFMDRASSLIFPGSRTLALWWRQLAHHQPQALWGGYAYVHRSEATVGVLAARPLDPLAGLVLQAIDLEEPAGASFRAAELAERLRLPEAIVQRVLRGLDDAGLLTSGSAEGEGEDWQASEVGRHALASRQVPHRACERRVRSEEHTSELQSPHV